MSNYFIADVLRDSGMMSLEQGMNIYHLLAHTILLEVPGAVVELGCCHGNTAILMQKTIELFNSDKKLHVFDSFEGLPAKHAKDGETFLKEGGCRSNRGILIKRFEKFKAPLPQIYEGWFKDTLNYLPPSISFAHLDGDFYTSIKESLEAIYQKLSPGAVVVVDDYCDRGAQKEIHLLLDANRYQKQDLDKFKKNPDICPGVKQACDEFFRDKPENVNVLLSGYSPHGYFRKQ